MTALIYTSRGGGFFWTGDLDVEVVAGGEFGVRRRLEGQQELVAAEGQHGRQTVHG